MLYAVFYEMCYVLCFIISSQYLEPMSTIQWIKTFTMPFSRQSTNSPSSTLWMFLLKITWVRFEFVKKWIENSPMNISVAAQTLSFLAISFCERLGSIPRALSSSAVILLRSIFLPFGRILPSAPTSNWRSASSNKKTQDNQQHV